MMKINMPINTVLEECKECPYCKILTDSLYAFDQPDIIVNYKCAHVDICENAIELYKKHCSMAMRKKE